MMGSNYNDYDFAVIIVLINSYSGGHGDSNCICGNIIPRLLTWVPVAINFASGLTATLQASIGGASITCTVFPFSMSHTRMVLSMELEHTTNNSR